MLLLSPLARVAFQLPLTLFVFELIELLEPHPVKGKPTNSSTAIPNRVITLLWVKSEARPS
jgi:hypothetical protein